MTRKRCPHIQECKQKIPKYCLQLCLGKLNGIHDFNRCFMIDELANATFHSDLEKKTPKEWMKVENSVGDLEK